MVFDTTGMFVGFKVFELALILRLVSYCSGMWRAVAQLIEALRYKAGGRGFDSRWCYWIFSLTS
jgi:hypothetical protein